MKTGYEASPTAQQKAIRTIGPQGLVSSYHEPSADGVNFIAIYQVGEWHAIGDHRIYGESSKSFRQAFEAAGIYDINVKPRTRT